MNPVRTTCPYCGVGCGVRVQVGAGGVFEVTGDEAHPANAGRLCVKGAALGETLDLEGRLLHPVIREAGGARRAGWDEALERVARGFQRIIAEHGPDAVAFYVSGQLLTEDYYVANKLMKGFIGSANIDTNSRLCMSSAVAGHKRAFGGDLVPVCYEDLELADLVVLVGSNTAWCHPILFQRIARAKEARPELKLVVIDPRRTATCELADLHLPVKSGTDVWLFNGLLSFLHRHGVVDTVFVGSHTAGMDEALRAALASAPDIRDVARACRLQAEAVGEFYRLFARTPKVVTAFSQGVNQSSSGTDKVNSIINCHLLTGRIGKPGAGPFSITGQPNAMGGREVGGLANMLAAHMELDNAEHRRIVQGFWNSPVVAERPGLKAVELFEAIHAGQVKAVWIMATNPVVSLPDADRVRAALQRCELVVVSDCVANTDTAALAHVLLPAAGWGEKDGTVTNSERRISRQRAFLPPAGEAKPDWWIISQVAARMGWPAAFAYTAPHQIFDEHARLSGTGNDGRRGFDISGLAGLTPAQYDALAPIQWPVLASPSPSTGEGWGGGETAGTARLFSDGRFFHPDGRARFIAVDPRPPQHMPDEEYPLVLNTGRIRDQWHTMTRTGKSPRLSSHLPEPFVEIHPYDAMLNGVQDGALVRVASRWGALVARLKTSGDVPRRSVFVPIHWNDQYASDARVGALVNPVVDPVSGEPEFKHTPVRVEPFQVDWHGFVLCRRALDMEAATWWTRIQGQRFLRYELGGRGQVADWPAWGRRLLGVADPEADWLEYCDDTAGIYRAAHVVDDRIEACVFVSPRPDLPSRAWLSGLFVQEKLEEVDRVGLLVGQPVNPQADTGPLVCSCFGVGRNVILDAIRKQGLTSAQQVGSCLKAGTNCGSCVPEIKSLIALAAASEAA
ncbi:MAG TPA: molybdopterin-dependent oxidoreductase [Nevskiales bacterium]|nr:molybdopterin-dependent oxidoreductase [Nevskiales bacterium]